MVPETIASQTPATDLSDAACLRAGSQAGMHLLTKLVLNGKLAGYLREQEHRQLRSKLAYVGPQGTMHHVFAGRSDG